MLNIYLCFASEVLRFSKEPDFYFLFFLFLFHYSSKIALKFSRIINRKFLYITIFYRLYKNVISNNYLSRNILR